MFGGGNFGRRCLVPTTQATTKATTVAPRCASTQGWKSSIGNTCATYELGFNNVGVEPERLCTIEGNPTPAFATLMAALLIDRSPSELTFDNDADDDGLTAKDACCVCGGGAAEDTTTGEPITTAKRDSIPCSGKKTDRGTECQCAANCHTCTVGSALQVVDGQCSVCKNTRSLFEGNCIESDVCEGTAIKGTVQGRGNFNRKCVVAEESDSKDETDDKETLVCAGKTTEGSSSQPCTCPINCHTCQGDVCLKCKNKQYNFDGQCISSSACNQVGGTTKGAGNFNRACEGGKQETTTTTTTTEAPCPTDALDHFNDVRAGIRLKGAGSFVLNNGKFASVDDAGDCAGKCIAYGTGSECKAFELKARGGQMRCNLLTSSSTLGTSIVSSAKYDLYNRANFC